MQKFYGDSTHWGIGVVEDIQDPLNQGRVRVRIHGLHTFDTNTLAIHQLPWSHVAIPANNAGTSGVGQTPTGLVEGSFVFGVFLDGADKQDFLVTNALTGTDTATVRQGQQLTQITESLYGDSNPERMYSYFRDVLGFAEEEAAGALGSVAQFMGTYTLEVVDVDHGEGRYGIGNWDESDTTALRQFASLAGKNYQDFDTQLLFLGNGLQHSDAWPNYSAAGLQLGAFDASQAADSFATNVLSLPLERDRNIRHNYARQALDAYGSSTNGDSGLYPERGAPTDLVTGDVLPSEEHVYRYIRSLDRTIAELIVTDTNTQPGAALPDDWADETHFLITEDGSIQIGTLANQPVENMPAGSSVTADGEMLPASRFTTSTEMRDQIKTWEDIRLEPYVDAYGYSIGYGYFIGTDDQPELFEAFSERWMGFATSDRSQISITRAQANELFDETIERFERIVQNAVNVDITQSQFDALVAFTYNLGGFSDAQTLIGNLNSGNYAAAADAFTLYVNFTNMDGERIRSDHLYSRRLVESEYFRRGLVGVNGVTLRNHRQFSVVVTFQGGQRNGGGRATGYSTEQFNAFRAIAGATSFAYPAVSIIGLRDLDATSVRPLFDVRQFFESTSPNTTSNPRPAPATVSDTSGVQGSSASAGGDVARPATPESNSVSVNGSANSPSVEPDVPTPNADHTPTVIDLDADVVETATGEIADLSAPTPPTSIPSPFLDPILGVVGSSSGLGLDLSALGGSSLTEAEVQALIDGSLVAYYTSSQVDNLLTSYYTSSQVDNLLTSYYTSSQVDTLLADRDELGELTDVTLTSPSTGQYLRYSGAGWVNATIDYSEIANTPTTLPPAAHTHVLADITDLNSTTDLPEGTNLYYTQARFDTAFGAKSTTDLGEGANLYYTQARFDTAFAGKDTDNLGEGLTNLYYTDTRANTAIDARVTKAFVDALNVDADTLDGLDSTAFGQLAVQNTWTQPQIFEGPSGHIQFWESDAGVDLKRWTIQAQNEGLAIQTRDDTGGFLASVFRVKRDGCLDQISDIVTPAITPTSDLTITVDDADFVVADSTDATSNYIWRDFSAGLLYLGAPTAAVTFRSDVSFNGNDITGVGNLTSSGDLYVTVDDADYAVRDTTDATTNFIFRDWSEGKLFLGTSNAEVFFRSDINSNGFASYFEATANQIYIRETDAAVGAKQWGLTAQGGVLTLQSRDDSYGFVANLVQFDRSGGMDISGDVIVQGDLTVNGTTTTLNTTELAIEDNIITLNSGVTGVPSLNAGIEVERGTSANVALRWNESTDKWQGTTDGTNYYDVLFDDGTAAGDAATLDGLDSTQFLRSDTTDQIRSGASGTYPYIQSNPSTNATNPSYFSWHSADGTRRGYIGWGSTSTLIVGEGGFGWAFQGTEEVTFTNTKGVSIGSTAIATGQGANLFVYRASDLVAEFQRDNDGDILRFDGNGYNTLFGMDGSRTYIRNSSGARGMAIGVNNQNNFEVAAGGNIFYHRDSTGSNFFQIEKSGTVDRLLFTGTGTESQVYHQTPTANSYVIQRLIDNSGTPYFYTSPGSAVQTQYADFDNHYFRNNAGVDSMRLTSSGGAVFGPTSGATNNPNVYIRNSSDLYGVVEFRTGTSANAQILTTVTTGNMHFDSSGDFLWRDGPSGSTNMTLGNAGTLTLRGFTATANQTILTFTPSNYGVGNPALNIKKHTTANQWNIELWDTSSTAGIININAGTDLRYNNNSIATQTWVNSQGFITSASGGDAATIDGLDSSQFLRSDQSDTLSTYGNTVLTIESLFPNSTTGGLTFNTVGDTSAARITYQKSGVTQGIRFFEHDATGTNAVFRDTISGKTVNTFGYNQNYFYGHLQLNASTPTLSFRVAGDTQQGRISFLNTAGSLRGSIQYDVTGDYLRYYSSTTYSEWWRFNNAGLTLYGALFSTEGVSVTGSTGTNGAVDISYSDAGGGFSTFPCLRITNTNTTGDSFAGIEIRGDNGTSVLDAVADGNGTGTISGLAATAGFTSGANAYVGTHSAVPLHLTYNFTPKASVGANGFYITGNTNSSHGLHFVGGDGRFFKPDNNVFLFDGCSNPGGGSGFWDGLHIGAADIITESATNRFPRASHNWSYTGTADPTDLMYNIQVGNAGTIATGIKIAAANDGPVNLNGGEVNLTTGGSVYTFNSTGADWNDKTLYDVSQLQVGNNVSAVRTDSIVNFERNVNTVEDSTQFGLYNFLDCTASVSGLTADRSRISVYARTRVSDGSTTADSNVITPIGLQAQADISNGHADLLYGLYSLATVNGGSDSNANISYAATNECRLDGAGSTMSQMYGTYSIVRTTATADQAITTGYGVRSLLNHDAAVNITTYYHYFANADIETGASVGTMYGFYYDAYNLIDGTVTNDRPIWIRSGYTSRSQINGRLCVGGEDTFTNATSILHVTDPESSGTGLHVYGGGGGGSLAYFQRNVGGTGTVRIHAPGNAPLVSFDTGNTGTSQWAIGNASSTTFRISNGADLTTSMMDLADSAGIQTLSLGGKQAIRFDDGWVRLNPSGNFSSGIYCGSSTLRTDGQLHVGASGTTFLVNGATITHQGNTVWTAGNDGAASGLDADLLDGVQGANYVRTDVNSTISGANLIFADNAKADFGTSQDIGVCFNGTNFVVNNTTSTGSILFQKNGTTNFTFAGVTGDFTATGNVTANSDINLKDILSPVLSSNIIDNLEVVDFRWKKSGETSRGVIAQEVERYAPWFVVTGDDHIKSVDYGKLAVAAVYEEKKKREALEEKVEKLEAMVEMLMEKLNGSTE